MAPFEVSYGLALAARSCWILVRTCIQAFSGKAREQELSGRRAVRGWLRSPGFCSDGLASRRIDLEWAKQLQLFAHLAHRRDHLFAHEPQAAHLILMGHR